MRGEKGAGKRGEGEGGGGVGVGGGGGESERIRDLLGIMGRNEKTRGKNEKPSAVSGCIMATYKEYYSTSTYVT